MPLWFTWWLRKRHGSPSRYSAPEAVSPERSARPAVDRTVVARIPRLLALSAATREYARAVESGSIDRLRLHDVAPLAEAMGPCLWSWQRARRLTAQAPWRAGSSADERVERIRAWREMTADVATWQRALSSIDAAAERARAYGDRPPEPLALPPEVAAIIEDRRKAALERAARRRGTPAAEGEPERPPDAAAHVPPTAPRPSRAPRGRRSKQEAARTP